MTLRKNLLITKLSLSGLKLFKVLCQDKDLIKLKQNIYIER